MQKACMVLALSLFVFLGVIEAEKSHQPGPATESNEVPGAMTETETTNDMFFPLPIVPPGACELPNGDCVIAPDTICRLLDGEFQGANTECE